MPPRRKDEGSFWTTLPGVLTAIAALVAAIASVIAAVKNDKPASSPLAAPASTPVLASASIATPVIASTSVPAPTMRHLSIRYVYSTNRDDPRSSQEDKRRNATVGLGEVVQFDTNNFDGCQFRVSVDARGRYTASVRSKHTHNGDWEHSEPTLQGVAERSAAYCQVFVDAASGDRRN